jgi:hypothetical protein
MRKWMVAFLHKGGVNVHHYWTGTSWTSNREHAILYPGEVDAQQVIRDLPISDTWKAHLRPLPVMVEFKET